MKSESGNLKAESPIARAERIFTECFPNEMFIERLLLYLRFGYVISTPNLFAMFRPVRARAAAETIVNPEHVFEIPDAWYVDFGVGELRQFPQLMPYPLPKICFWRKLRTALRRYDTNRLFRRIALCR